MLFRSAYVRRQFGLSIGRFEGVQEALARIAGLTYQLEATRRLTTTGLDLGERPGIVTAIAKYHMTEQARLILNDAMDIHAGRNTAPPNAKVSAANVAYRLVALPSISLALPMIAFCLR